jgi:hypothetical protein
MAFPAQNIWWLRKQPHDLSQANKFVLAHAIGDGIDFDGQARMLEEETSA